MSSSSSSSPTVNVVIAFLFPVRSFFHFVMEYAWEYFANRLNLCNFNEFAPTNLLLLIQHLHTTCIYLTVFNVSVCKYNFFLQPHRSTITSNKRTMQFMFDKNYTHIVLNGVNVRESDIRRIPWPVRDQNVCACMKALSHLLQYLHFIVDIMTL